MPVASLIKIKQIFQISICLSVNSVGLGFYFALSAAMVM